MAVTNSGIKLSWQQIRGKPVLDVEPRKEFSHVNSDHAKAEYEKLKGLIENLSRIAQRAKKTVNLQEVEPNLHANANNPEALSNLERNMRNVRASILSEVEGVLSNSR